MGQTISSSFVWNTPPVPDPESVEGGEFARTLEDGVAFAIELNDAAAIPARATGSAGYVLGAAEHVTLQSAERKLIGTGVKFAMEDVQRRLLPPDTVVYGAIKGRSGLAMKGIDVFNGTIDSDNCGEIKVLMQNNSATEFDVKIGDRIAQIVFCVALTPTLVEHQDVSQTFRTERGDGGFGSTGTRAVPENTPETV